MLRRQASLSEMGAVVSICAEPLRKEYFVPGSQEPKRVVTVVAGPENCGCFVT
jgi:hypothetical protein